MPRGHAMLVRVGERGKQSLTRFATTILDSQIIQITPGRTHQTADFLIDSRDLYRRAGILKRPIAFVLADNEVKEGSFLKYINNILTAGEISNLFSQDTYKASMVHLKPVFSKECKGQIDTDEKCFELFL
jgi:dynein heavy chain